MNLFKYLFFIVFSFKLQAQLQTKNWYFGNRLGVSFTDTGITILNNSGMNTVESTATISDKNGNLLFYTDGDRVYNRNHTMMINGFGLRENITYYAGLASQCLIIPFTNDTNLFYIFTTNNKNTQLLADLSYAVVDLSRNNGLGAVIEKNNLIERDLTPSMTVIKHCNKKDYWLAYITYEKNIDSYFFNTLLIKHDGTKLFNEKTKIPNGWRSGQLKANIEGNLVAWVGGINFANFDNSTGKIYNIIVVNPEDMPHQFYYSVEFSQSGKYIYNTKYRINTENLAVKRFNDRVFALDTQIGLDGKIYISTPNISIINNPDAENIDEIDFSLGMIPLNHSNTGISIFPSFLFNSSPIFKYHGESVNEDIFLYYEDSLSLDSAKWLFTNDNYQVNGFSTNYIFNTQGNQGVEFIMYKNGQADTLKQCVTIYDLNYAFLGEDTSVCSNQPVFVKAKYPAVGEYRWSTGDETSAIWINEPGTYWLEVENNCGISKDTINITLKDICSKNVILFPNIISPNNDGVNDFFSPLFVDQSLSVPSIHYEIYNRWGVKLYQGNPSLYPWDGTDINGNKLQIGVYFYTVYHQRAVINNGFVQLID